MKTEITGTPGDVTLARRSFLRLAGAGVAAAGLATVASCKKLDALPQKNLSASGSIDIGSGDYGILNFAYALEQLEAAFYTQVVATPYNGIAAGELDCFTTIRQHEVCHREF